MPYLLLRFSLLLALAAVTLGAAERAAGDTGAFRSLETARQDARRIRSTIVAAVYPTSQSATGALSEAERLAFGPNLADYAANPGADPAHFENTVEASRRILAGGTTTRQTPAATSRALHRTADAILAAVRDAESAPGPHRSPELEASLAELRASALLARFHARRLIAAVHYNLFKRGLKLAELVAATMQEKEAVAAWRELVALGGSSDVTAARSAELKKLHYHLRELEEQCCPPDEAIMKEKVWDPATDQPADTPQTNSMSRDASYPERTP